MSVTFTIPKALWLTSNRHITNRPYRALQLRRDPTPTQTPTVTPADDTTGAGA